MSSLPREFGAPISGRHDAAPRRGLAHAARPAGAGSGWRGRHASGHPPAAVQAALRRAGSLPAGRGSAARDVGRSSPGCGARTVPGCASRRPVRFGAGCVPSALLSVSGQPARSVPALGRASSSGELPPARSPWPGTGLPAAWWLRCARRVSVPSASWRGRLPGTGTLCPRVLWTGRAGRSAGSLPADRPIPAAGVPSATGVPASGRVSTAGLSGPGPAAGPSIPAWSVPERAIWGGAAADLASTATRPQRLPDARLRHAPGAGSRFLRASG
jgi:hypothetical protein